MNNRYRISLLILLLGGFALRLYRLGGESLWYDETVSVVLARKSIPDLIAHTAGDIHPPGYYLLLHFWSRLTHPTLDSGLEFLFAWPSLFFGLLLLPLLFVIGRKTHTLPIGTLALLLAAVNPFHLWYSQEVRMYTMGAVLGLVCLWSLLKYFSVEAEESQSAIPSPSIKPLLGYVFSAAIGLYSLYYFAFALIGLNVIALAAFLQQLLAKERVRYQKFGIWLAAQVGVILLWSPWLPIFWRQAIDPPVPPWRAGWTWPQFGHDLLESFSALVAGQTAVEWSTPIFAAVAFVAFVLYALVMRKPSRWMLLIYLLVPISVIYLLTIFVTPLYHVRYLFIYAPVFMIVLAALFVWLGQKNRWLATTLLAILISTNVSGLMRFWQHPAYQADDHRNAVADLANRWRPSDLILVNAGWAYTVLETYWPAGNGTGLNQTSITPPQIVATERLVDVIDFGSSQSISDGGQTPLLVRTGSVDASANLGWGDPQSDFFAITEAETVAALSSLADCYRRLWHYRIYDTVNDPDGVIRNWLSTNGTLQSEQWISGRDFGQVQLFELTNQPDEEDNLTACDPNFIPWQPIVFGDMLQLNNVAVPSIQKLGQILYVTLEWEPLPALATEAPLGMSLRLYADVETQILQQDETPNPQTVTWLDASTITNSPIRHSLALPIPSQTAPGIYSLELIVYRIQDGTPLSLPERDNTVWGQRLQLNQVELQP